MIGLRHISMILMALLFGGLASCGNGNRNFNKQKFTNLKKIKPAEETAVVETEDYISYEEVDHIDKQVDEIAPLDEIQKPVETLEEVETPNEYAELPESPQEVKKKRLAPGHRNDFEKLDEDEKRQRIIEFNRSFNNILIIFLIGLALGCLGFINILLAIPGAIFWVIAWIYSFIPLLSLKRIDKFKYDQKLQVRIMWMRLLKVVGILICIGTLTPGLILLILWLARVF